MCSTSSVNRAGLPCTALMGMLAMFASVALLSCGVAAADTVEANFEAPTFHPGSVNGQDGWTSSTGHNAGAGPHGYDQEVVDNNALVPRVAPPEFGGQSLRISNAYMSQEFEGQTRSNGTKEAAGENLPNMEYTAQFSFISIKPTVEQPGLTMSISPTESLGARMSYIGLRDTPAGVAVSFYDVKPDGEFVAYDLGTLPRDKPHTIKFWIALVPGENNDFVRIFIDGRDVSECFTTWENMYRAEHLGVPDINLLEFRTGGPVGETPSLLGGGFLFDNVKITTAKGPGPGQQTCDLPIEKQAETRTARPGGHVRYRITVRNRGRLSTSNVLMCDRIPREMTFVSADRKLLRLGGGRRCLLIGHLAPGQHVTFHPVLRVDANARAGEVDNEVEEIPGGGPAGTLPPVGETDGAGPPGYLHLLSEDLPAGAKTGFIPAAEKATAKVAVVRAKRPGPPPVTG